MKCDKLRLYKKSCESDVLFSNMPFCILGTKFRIDELRIFGLWEGINLFTKEKNKNNRERERNLKWMDGFWDAHIFDDEEFYVLVCLRESYFWIDSYLIDTK